MLKLLLLLSLLFTACLPKSENSLTGEVETLTISGQLLDEDGIPVGGAEIFLDDQPGSLGTVASDGQFEIMITSTRLRVLEANLSSQNLSEFNLYFSNADRSLVGVSEALTLGMIAGPLSDAVTMTTGETLTGQISVLERGEGLVPTKAAIKIGRWMSYTNDDGSFTLTGIPAGDLRVSIYAPGYKGWSDTVSTDADSFKEFLSSLVLFEESGVTGVMLMDNDSRTLAGEDPLQRWFSVRYSDEVGFVRVSEDIRQLEIEETSSTVVIDNSNPTVETTTKTTVEPAEWFPIASLLSYKFSTVGSKKLYYQFSDSSQNEKSEIFSIKVNVDLFGDFPGSILLADGAEESNSSTVNVAVSVPSTAAKMRVGESSQELEQESFVALSSSFTYNFSSSNSGNGTRTLMVQFEDVNGNLSQVYSDSIELVLFPEGSEADDVLSFEVKSEADVGSEIEIQMVLPLAAAEYRVYDFAFNADNEPDWLPIANTHIYTMENRVARYVYVQFRDANGNISDAYQILVSLDEE